MKIFLVIFILLIISSSICYWWIEIDSNEQVFYNQIEQIQPEDLILSKYLNDPYQINVWNIINQSKRKYFDSKHDKYLVYSCRFMCGGKKRIYSNIHSMI